MNHPQVGEIELQSNKFTVNGTDGLMLVVFHAPPNSRSAEPRRRRRARSRGN